MENKDTELSNESSQISKKIDNEYFLKYFNNNFEDSFNMTFNIFLYSIYISSTLLNIFFFSLLINSIFSISNIFIGIIAFSLILSYIILANLYLKMKGMIDSENKKIMNIGNLVTFICFNIVALMIITFSILIIIKFNDFKIISMFNASIPLFIGSFVSICYLLFITPALYTFKLYSDFALYFIFISCLLSFDILLSYKIDNIDNNIYWYQIGIPIIIFLSFYLIYNIYNFQNNKETCKNSNLKFYLFVISMILIGISIELYLLNRDNFIEIKESISFTLAFISSFFFNFDKIFFSCFFDDENRKKEEHNTSENGANIKDDYGNSKVIDKEELDVLRCYEY